MSYILEALKKSEEKRNQEIHSSPLHTASASYARKTHAGKRRSPLIPISLIFLLFIGGYVYFKQPFSQPSNPPQKIIKSPAPPKAPPPEYLPQERAPQEIPELRAGKKKLVNQPPKPLAARGDVLQPAPILTTPPLELPEPPPHVALVPYLRDLDASFRQTVPRLKLAGHVYSPDPALRLILINSNIVRELDVVEKNFILDEITPNGIILRTGKTRFRLDAD